MVVAGKRAGGAARFGDIQVRQRDRMPIARQRLRRGLADAAARAGDDCNPLHVSPPLALHAS